MRTVRQVCFRLRPPGLPPATIVGLTLADCQAVALGELLQVLACGEESAALAFAGLADRRAAAAAGQALSSIAADELAHEAMLRGLRQAVPEPAADPLLRRLLPRFFQDLAEDDPGLHFANIVALDSAVCIILGALLAPERPLARDPATAAALGRIRRDEARHVRLARGLATVLTAPRLALACARRTREGLVALLALRAAAFDALEVAPAALFQRLRNVSPGLVT